MLKDKKLIAPEEIHKKQIWLEIYLPLMIVLILSLTAGVFTIIGAVGGNSAIGQWSAISIILLILPILILCPLLIVMLFYLDGWMIRANRTLPLPLKQVRLTFGMVNNKFQRFLLSFVAAVYSIQSRIIRMKEIFSRSNTGRN